jgi:hypothetical protein
LAFTGITTDLEGLPIITRKQANALAAVTARVLAVRGANRETKAFCYGRILLALLPVHTSRVNSRGFNGQ